MAKYKDSRLDRTVFVENAKRDWKERPDPKKCREGFLIEALAWVLTHRDKRNPKRVSREAVGAAKVIKIALAVEAFVESKEAAGGEDYTLEELHEYIRDILDA